MNNMDFNQFTSIQVTAIKQNDNKHEEKTEELDDNKKAVNKKMFQCEICQCLLSRKSHLERHILFKHTQEKRLKCDFCGKGFVEQHDLKLHEKVHIGQDYYPCDVCDKSFTMKHHLNNHKKFHTGIGLLDCNLCEKKFAVQAKLKNHISKYHESSEKIIRCNLCNKIFQTRARLAYHKKRIHEENYDKEYNCKNCNESFSTIRSYSIHRRIHTGRKPPKCDKCDKTFEIIKDLRHHEILIHGIIKKKKDGEGFRTLRRNKFKLKGNLPYSCDLCVNSFLYPYELKNHKRNVHDMEVKFDIINPIDELPFDQDAVGFDEGINNVFDGKEKAEKTISKISSKDNIDKEFNNIALSCELCEQTFQEDSDFTAHRKTYHRAENKVTEILNNEIIGYSITSTDNEKNLKQDNIIPEDDIVNQDNRKSKRVQVKQNKSNDRKKNPSPSHDDDVSVHSKEKRKIKVRVKQNRSNEQKKRYKCKLCKQTFSSYDQLQQHRIEHANRIPFHCDVCNKSYFTERQLQRHKLKNTCKVLFSCEVCDKSFLRKWNFDRHVHELHLKRKKNLTEHFFIENFVKGELVTEDINAEDFDKKDLGTEDLVIENLVTENLVTEDLVYEDLGTEDLVNEDLFTEDLITEDLVIENLVTENLVTENLVTEDLVTEDLVTENLVSENFISEENLEEKVDLDCIDHYESIKISQVSNLEMSCSMELDDQSFVVILHVQSNSKEYKLKENTNFVGKALEDYINDEVFKQVNNYLQQNEEHQVNHLKENKDGKMEKSGCIEKDGGPFQCDVCTKNFLFKVDMEIHKTIISNCNISYIQENKIKDSEPKYDDNIVNLQVGFPVENQMDFRFNINNGDNSEEKKDIFNDKIVVNGIDTTDIDLEYDGFIPQHDIIKVEEDIISNPSPSHDVSKHSKEKRKIKVRVKLNKSNKQNKRYKCKSCKETFTSFYQLQKHKVIHTNKVPFSCEICNKGFYTKLHLQKHNKCEFQQNKPKQKKKFKCKLCKQAFISHYQLQQHKVNQHTKKVPFSCEICNKSFYTKFNFVRHNECEFHLEKVRNEKIMFKK